LFDALFDPTIRTQPTLPAERTMCSFRFVRAAHRTSMKKCSPVASSTRNSTVPAFLYLASAVRRTASACSLARSTGSRFHAGAISTTFWWRRCTEQSRSHRWITPPLPSPTICTSMWRGLNIRRKSTPPDNPRRRERESESREAVRAKAGGGRRAEAGGSAPTRGIV
jgi:hypothetical protein